MVYTSHGHHIQGSIPNTGDKPPVARCGGPGLCGKCSAEQSSWQLEAARLAELKKLDDAITRHEGILIPQEFVTKIVKIKAIQFTGGASNGMDIVDWVKANGGEAHWTNAAEPWISEDGITGHSGWPESLTIKTLEGNMEASPGWWIVQGLEGEFYPVKDSVFRAKYEEVNG